MVISLQTVELIKLIGCFMQIVSEAEHQVLEWWIRHSCLWHLHSIALRDFLWLKHQDSESSVASVGSLEKNLSWLSRFRDLFTAFHYITDVIPAISNSSLNGSKKFSVSFTLQWARPIITNYKMVIIVLLVFLSVHSYRKVVSNNCTAGVSMEYTARRQQCPIQAPKGLHLVTSEGSLTATLGSNVTFLVFLEEVGGFLFNFLFFFLLWCRGRLAVCACVRACAGALACRPKWTRRKSDPCVFFFIKKPAKCVTCCLVLLLQHTAESQRPQCLFL